MNGHRLSVVSLCLGMLVGSWGCEISAQHRSGGEGANANFADENEGVGGAGGAECMPVPDGNPCTNDLCLNGVPSYEPVVDGTECDDGNACTVNDICQAGMCTGANISCNAGEVCNDGACVSICSGVLAPPQVVESVPTAPPWSVAIADVNGDGKNDLVVSTGLDLGADVHSVGILINEGHGQFAPIVHYPVSGYPRVVIAGDLNGDGKPDLVIANLGYKTITVLLNQGDGTFGDRIDYEASPTDEVYDVTLIDLNGDGALDIVGTPSALEVWMNQGSGTFMKTQYYWPDSWPALITAADMNSDGAQDLVVAAIDNYDTMQVFLNDGSSNIAQWKMIEHPLIAESPLQLVVADFDGDTNPDVAVNSVGILMVMRNQGDGTLVDHGQYMLGDWPAGLGAADFNGDGLPDLVITEQKSQSVRVLLNQGNAVFAPDAVYMVEGSPPGGDVKTLATGDLDGDEKPDVVFVTNGNNSIEQLLNTCSQ